MHISIPGNWASNNPVFAISHGPCAAAPSTPSQCSALPRHAVVPSRFPVQVRQAAQRRPPSEPLLSVRVIQRRVRRRNFALRPAFPASLAGRHPCDYYGHSVALGLASRRRSHGHYCRTYRARLRRPVRLLQCPDRASLLRPGGLPQVLEHPEAGAGAGSRRLSGGRCLAPSGNWASGNPAFAISRGSPGTPSRTPEHGRRFAWHATVPFTFQIQVKPSDPRTPPPVPARCAGDTAAAPRGAVEATMNSPSGNRLPAPD